MGLIISILIVAIPVAVAVIQLYIGRRRSDQAAVLWTLAVALDKNLPLADELEALAVSLSKKQAKRALWMAEGIRLGDSFSEALQDAPGLIPRAAIVAASVAEENGTLPETMRDAATRFTKRVSATHLGLPAGASFYPLAVFLVTVLILSGLMYFIVPKFKKIFEDFGYELPAFTNQVIHVADFAVQYPLLHLAAVAIPAAATGYAIICYCNGWGEQDVPLVGRWFRRLDTPGVLRNLANTLAADQSPGTALRTLSRIHPRRAVRRALSAASSQFQQGDDCWHALRDAGLITAREVAALRAAQRVGNVVWVLEQLADAIERRLANRWLTTLTVAEPATILLVAIVVASLAVAFFSPLVTLIEKVA